MNDYRNPATAVNMINLPTDGVLSGGGGGSGGSSGNGGSGGSGGAGVGKGNENSGGVSGSSGGGGGPAGGFDEDSSSNSSMMMGNAPGKWTADMFSGVERKLVRAIALTSKLILECCFPYCNDKDMKCAKKLLLPAYQNGCY